MDNEIRPTQDAHRPAHDADDKTSAMLCHLLSLIQFAGMPLGGIIGPLIIWLAKREDPFVDANGKESLNFQISMLIYAFISLLTIFIVIGFVLFPLVLITNLVFSIVAGLRANDGEVYRYPLTIRFIK